MLLLGPGGREGGRGRLEGRAEGFCGLGEGGSAKGHIKGR